MARLRSLVNLRSDVASRAGVTLSSSGRHTTTQATRDINQSIQAWRNKVLSAAPGYYLQRLTATTSTSTTTSAEGWEAREYVEIDEGTREVVAVSVKVGEQWVPMQQMSWTERSDFDTSPEWGGSGTGRPAFWMVGGRDNVTTHSHYLLFAPKADAAYTLAIDVNPIFDDLSADVDLFDGIMGGEEWVVSDVVRKMYLRDGLAGTPEYQALLADMRGWEQDMLLSLARQRGPGRKRDTWGERRALANSAHDPWRRL